MITKPLITGLVLSLLALSFAAKTASAQTHISPVGVKLTTLHSFTGLDGAQPSPSAPLVQAINGDFYGTTATGGAHCDVYTYCGTIFKITPSGVLTALYSFCSLKGCTDSADPNGLVQATNGYLYGTTNGTGSSNYGTVFKITPSGELTTLHTFCPYRKCLNGNSFASLVQAANGDLYGTTFFSAGTVFKITPGGALTRIYNFCSQSGCADGRGPEAGLIQAANGLLYGSTFWGGASTNNPSCPLVDDEMYGCGTVYKITPDGKLTTVYSFCSLTDCTDGTGPAGPLVRTAEGDIYGITTGGGITNSLCVPSCGTIFKLTPTGTLTTLYRFCSQAGCADGFSTLSGLIEAADGDLYGLTPSGGEYGYGTIFKITPAGTFTTQYSFCSQTGCPDGSAPTGLLQATNGIFYGTTATGGAKGDGTVFSLSIGLAPFVKTLPVIGTAGDAVTILGYELTGATSVTFNGTPAAFTVVSSTEITTTVPAGAATGKVQVITPDGPLSSNVAFQVAP
jgi:uncharacterized repeat protein (TIGR03803 family)